MNDVTIIGAGIMGCSVARELSRYRLSVCVLEKGADIADGTSRANSGIVHAGFDAAQGTRKAAYNVRGSVLYPSLAAELGFSFCNNGSLVLAFDDEERASLDALLANGRANGVAGLEIIDAEALHEREPAVSTAARAALFAPTGAITNPYEVTLAFAENAHANGVSFSLNTEVVGIERAGDCYRLSVCDVRDDDEAAADGVGLSGGATRDAKARGVTRVIETRCVVNTAGVFADRMSAMVSAQHIKITARKGEYCIFDKRCGDAVRSTIFRAPSAAGKGVLVSPTVDGNIIVGPNAHSVDRDAENGALDTSAEGIAEVITKARDLWPTLPEDAIIASFAGLRASPDKRDFVIGEAFDAPGFYNAAGIDSPGLTAAPAIACDLAREISQRLHASLRPDFSPYREAAPTFVSMGDTERNERIAHDPAWGRIVCRCEEVTEAEVCRAIHAPIPAITLDAIKWRTRAGMGRCHGGFCLPHVAALIARETVCALDEVCKDGGGSRIACAGGARKVGGTCAELPDIPPVASSCEKPVETQRRCVDVVVVGGGAAGIAAALAARAEGVPHVLLVDREEKLGGILKQCIHPGFGLERFDEELTGPEYAERDIRALAASDIEVLLETTVLDIVCSDVAAPGGGAPAVEGQGATVSDRGATVVVGEGAAGETAAVGEGAAAGEHEAVAFGGGGATSSYESRAPMELSDARRPCTLRAVGPQGLFHITASALILATGSRERSRGQVGITGDRPAGVYAAGCAQHFINLLGTLPGKRAVILGSGDIGLIMARRLVWEGVEVVAVVERGPHPKGLQRNVVQCLQDNGIPLLLSHSVTRVIGKDRVRAVEVVETDPVTKQAIPGTAYLLECDTFLLSCGLIPERDLLDEAGIGFEEGGDGVSSQPSVFVCGNAAHIHDIVDKVTAEGSQVGKRAAAWVLGRDEMATGAACEAHVRATAAKGVARARGEDEVLTDAQARVEEEGGVRSAAETTVWARTRMEAGTGGTAKAEALPWSKEVQEAVSVEASAISVAASSAATSLASSAEDTMAVTCICCPKGCTITVEGGQGESGFVVTGNQCRRGERYAIEEVTAPKRTLTTTVRCTDSAEPLSVRTDIAIPKEIIPACLSALAEVSVRGPVEVGDCVLAAICGTDANIIATKCLP